MSQFEAVLLHPNHKWHLLITPLKQQQSSGFPTYCGHYLPANGRVVVEWEWSGEGEDARPRPVRWAQAERLRGGTNIVEGRRFCRFCLRMAGLLALPRCQGFRTDGDACQEVLTNPQTGTHCHHHRWQTDPVAVAQHLDEARARIKELESSIEQMERYIAIVEARTPARGYRPASNGADWLGQGVLDDHAD